MTTTTMQFLCVTYFDGQPCLVTAIDDKDTIGDFTFEWCKRDQCLYWHRVLWGGDADDPRTLGRLGSGDKITYWAAPEITIADPENGRRLEAPLEAWPLDTLFDRVDKSECQYCSACDDWFPTEDTNRPCRHVWWCDAKGWWSTPDERCGVECEDCFPVEEPR